MTSEGLNPHQSTLNELSAIEQSLIKNLGHLGNTFAHLGNDSDQIITREEFENGLSEYIEDLNVI